MHHNTKKSLRFECYDLFMMPWSLSVHSVGVSVIGFYKGADTGAAAEITTGTSLWLHTVRVTCIVVLSQ